MLLQVGCGVGNTAYPLLELNPHSEVYACDFAPSAVELVKAHPQYSCGRMHAFVADITSDDLMAEVTPEAVDICTMVFVLSAITPAKMRLVRAIDPLHKWHRLEPCTGQTSVPLSTKRTVVTLPKYDHQGRQCHCKCHGH